MATKINSTLKEAVERYKKAAKAAEAIRRVNQTNQLVSKIAQAGRELKRQRESSK